MLRCSICSRIYQNGTQEFCTNDGGKLLRTETATRPFKRVSLRKSFSFAPDLSTTKLQRLGENIINAFEALPTTPLELPKEWQEEQEWNSSVPVVDSSRQVVSQNENKVFRQSLTELPVSPQVLSHRKQHRNFQSSQSLIAASLFAALLVMIGATFVGAYFLREQKLLENNNSVLAVTANEFYQKTSDQSQNLSAQFVKFHNLKKNSAHDANNSFVQFSIVYPNRWQNNSGKTLFVASESFLNLTNAGANNFPTEQISINSYASRGSFAADTTIFPILAEKLSADYAGQIPDYKRILEGLTTINNRSAYEFRFEGKTIDQNKNQIRMWGRTIFLPAEKASAKNGLTITILATSLAAEDLSDARDVGEKSELLQILKTIEF